MKFLLGFLIIVNLWAFETNMTILKDYKIINIDFKKGQIPYKAIHSWEEAGQKYYLVLNQNTLVTQIKNFLPEPKIVQLTVFSRLKSKILSLPDKLHNFGITKPNNKKLFITIDNVLIKQKSF